MTGRVTPPVVTLTTADFEAVEYLRAKNTNTLGFLPKNAILEFLEAGRYLGVRDKGDLIAYLLFALAIHHIRVIHLCIEEEARERGYARDLINHLKELARQQDVGLIKLNCRRDYDAHRMWNKLGFVAVDEKPAKTPGEVLTVWNLAIEGCGEPDLFDIVASDDMVNVVIDAQIFFHFQEPDSRETRVSKMLQADFVLGSLRLFITDEMFAEIDRSEDSSRREASRNAAHQFDRLHHREDEMSLAISKLNAILPNSTKSQKSDIRQLAMTSASDVNIFVTRDKRLLNATDDIKEAVDVSVLDPTTLIVQLDELARPGSYVPSRVSGTDMSWRRLGHEELHDPSLFSSFQESDEKRHRVEGPLRESLSDPKKWVTEGLWFRDELVAIRAMSIQTELDQITVNLCRASRSKEQDLFEQFVTSSILHEAVRSGCGEVYLLPNSVAPRLDKVLRHFGFSKTNNGFTRLCLQKAVSLPELRRRKEISDCQSSMPVGGIEKACSPVVLEDRDGNYFMVPIKPGYAQTLFDIQRAGEDLFGGDRRVLLRWENVYFRRQSHHHMLKPPARILWYVSGSVGAVVAVSHLDGVEIGSPKDMFRKHRRLGALRWHEIYEMCEGEEVRKIMVLRFSHTYLFNDAAYYADLQSLYQKRGKRLVVQSPSRVPKELFLDIFQMGFAKRRPS